MPRERVYIWTTRDGRQIPVDQMDDGHLNNTIAMLRRRAERGDVFLLQTKGYRALRTEQLRREKKAMDVEFRDATHDRELPAPLKLLEDKSYEHCDFEGESEGSVRGDDGPDRPLHSRSDKRSDGSNEK